MHQLNEWNIEGYLLDEIILKQHSKEVLQCYDMLEDQISKQVYEGIIRWRILERQWRSLKVLMIHICVGCIQQTR